MLPGSHLLSVLIFFPAIGALALLLLRSDDHVWIRRLALTISVAEFLLSLLMIPGVLYLLINNYVPMFGVIIAFKDINYQAGILGSDWIGFKNFEYLFKTKDVLIITRNTILYNSLFIVVHTV